jgi:hypothetical protein
MMTSSRLSNGGSLQVLPVLVVESDRQLPIIMLKEALITG